MDAVDDVSGGSGSAWVPDPQPHAISAQERAWLNHEQIWQDALRDERERIERDVMEVISGIALSHKWFPLDAVLKAIRGDEVTR